MIIRRTQSLCPVCLRRLDAAYEEENGAVLLRKTCPDHGAFSVPVWRASGENAFSAAAFQDWSRPKTPSYPKDPGTESRLGCPFDCGLCPLHAQHTCTGLLEITRRCNMTCPVCYASAGGGLQEEDPPLSNILLRLEALKKASGACNVQISGGEPTVRNELPEIISLTKKHGFALVQINTNGLKLAEDANYARTLKNAGLDSVYLQWDGVREETFRFLRGRDCLLFKRRAVENCARAGLGIVLVATLVRGVNEQELGDLLRLALRMGPAIRGLHLQPAAFFGRFPWALEAAPRLTLSEVMALLASQAPELVKINDLHPPGCEHELCSFSALYRRISRQGTPGLERLGRGAGCSCAEEKPTLQKPLPLAAEGSRAAKRFVALHWQGVQEQDASREKSSACASTMTQTVQAELKQRFTLSAMAFQDALSLDISRVRGCCIHVVRPDGRLIPFCLHNLTSINGVRLYGGPL